MAEQHPYRFERTTPDMRLIRIKTMVLLSLGAAFVAIN
jgi:hypothetical protein